MNKSSFDLWSIKVFLTVANYRSLKEASTVLGVTVSAVSQILKSLEEDLQTQLLKRDVRPFQLTAAGRKLQSEGTLLLEAADSLHTRLSSEKCLLESLRLGLGESATATISPFLLSLLRNKVANLNMSSGMTQELVNKLHHDEVDVLVSTASLLDEEKWSRQEIYREQFLLLSGKIKVEIGDRETLERLSKTRPYVTYGEDSWDKVLTDRYLRSLNIMPLEVIHVSSSYAISGLVKECGGWAILPANNALGGKTFLDEIDWAPLPKNKPLSRSMWVVGDRSTRLLHVNMVAKAAQEALKEHFMPIAEKHAPDFTQYIELL